MKLSTVIFDDTTTIALIDTEAGVARRVRFIDGRPIADMNELIARFDPARSRLGLDPVTIPLPEVVFAAPIPRPRRNVICVGKNYHDHAHEFARSGFDSSASKASDAVPTAPIFFTKVPESVVGTGTPILYPTGVSNQLDYEAELGVIIGKGGRGIQSKDALAHVFGFTIINDVTARDLQSRNKQWFLGKSLDSFCPMGPWIATADELDSANLSVKCWINGELRQDGNTQELIFDIPTLIETLSAGLTLQPGDVIATGTPAGVGIGFDPPRFLQRGDVIDIKIEGLGRLSNTIV